MHGPPLYLCPLPDAEGVRKTKALFREKYGRDITDDEAADILGRVMRYVWLLREAESRYDKTRPEG